MTLTRRTTLGLILATIAVPAFAKDQTFNTDGMAIRGYDPVAYFTMSKPVKGDASHSSDYNGATWAFSSAENKALFDADPAKYAPKYGGYCAYAVSKGATIHGGTEHSIRRGGRSVSTGPSVSIADVKSSEPSRSFSALRIS